MKFSDAQKNLRLKLEEIKNENNDIVSQANKSIVACRNTLESMSIIILTTTFVNEEEEINFFKNVKIFPLSQLIYYSKIRTFEIGFPKINIRKQKKYIIRKINKIYKFHQYNIDFIQYINLGKNHLDPQYFTSKNSNILNFTNSKTYCFSPKFSTSHDILLAKIQGFVPYLDYLKKN